MNVKARNAEKAKRPMTNKKYLRIWIPVLATVTALVVVANIGLVVGSGWVASQLGSGTYTFTNSQAAAGWDTEYHTTEFADMDEVDAAARARRALDLARTDELRAVLVLLRGS